MAEEIEGTEENPIVEINATLEYRDGVVYIKKINTNEMPAKLLFKIIEAMTTNIREHYRWNFKIGKNKEN